MTKKKPVELGEQSGIYSVMLQKSGVERPPVFIDLGARYPASGGLSLVVWGRNRRNFPASLESDLLGERICVTGEVYLYKGEAYMELTSPSQIALC